MSFSSQMMEEWKFSRALWVPCSRFRLTQCVIRALNSYSSQWVKVSLTLVPRWIPYPSLQICGMGHSGPLLRCSLTPHYISLGIALVITVWLTVTQYWIVKSVYKVHSNLAHYKYLDHKERFGWFNSASTKPSLKFYMKFYPYPSNMEIFSIFL